MQVVHVQANLDKLGAALLEKGAQTEPTIHGFVLPSRLPFLHSRLRHFFGSLHQYHSSEILDVFTLGLSETYQKMRPPEEKLKETVRVNGSQ